MTLRAFFQQNTAYNAADLRALVDNVGLQDVGTDGRVIEGLTVTNESSSLVVAPGMGLAKAIASSIGTNFAVVNSTDETAVNETGGGTTWAPEASSSSRIDIVYLQVDDIALDGASTDVTTAYYKLGTPGGSAPSLPNKSCILLARVTSANSSLSSILDYRLLDPKPLGMLGTATTTTRWNSSPNTGDTLVSSTVTVGRNRRIKISGHCLLQCNPAPPAPAEDWNAQLLVYRGGSQVPGSDEIGRLWQQAGGGKAIETIFGFTFDTPSSAGSYQYSLRAGAPVASYLEIRGDLMPTRILVEDLGEV